MNNSVNYTAGSPFVDGRTYGTAPVISNVNENLRRKHWNLPNSNLDYNAFDFLIDAKSALYRSVQEGEMQAINDKLIVEQQIEDAATSALQAMEEDNQATMGESLYKLYQLGVLEEGDTDTNKLYNVVDNSKKNQQELREDYLHNLEQYTSSINAYDISQYYTNKSNSDISSVSNFLYKMPATMGSSFTSPMWQILSTAGAWAGAKAGAVAGSYFGPYGAAIGGVGGAVIGSLSGGIPSRMEESHIEAYDAYRNKLLELINDPNSGVDYAGVIERARKQIQNDPRYADKSLTDEMVIDILATDPDIKSGDQEFDYLSKEAFRGTRRVYEKNMNLEAGEVASEVAFFTPVGKFLKPVAKTGKKVLNPIKQAFGKRAVVGADVAKKSLEQFGKDLTSNTTRNAWGNALKKTTMEMIQEGSEEGAQYIIQDDFTSGAYADDDFNVKFWDSLTSGNIATDIMSNFGDRLRSTVAVFTPFDPIYSNDAELSENYISGMALSVLSPQSVIANVKNYAMLPDQIKQTKAYANIMQDALLKQDEVDRSVDLAKTMLQNGMSIDSYQNVLNATRDALKSGEYDISAIMDEGSQKPTEQQIDDFMDEQQVIFDRMRSSVREYTQKPFGITKSKIDKLGISTDDQPYFFGLLDSYRQDANIAKTTHEITSNILRGKYNASMFDYFVDPEKPLSTEDINKKVSNSLQYVINQRFQEMLAGLSKGAEAQAYARQNGLTNYSSIGDITELVGEITKYLNEHEIEDTSEFASLNDPILSDIRELIKGYPAVYLDSVISQKRLNKFEHDGEYAKSRINKLKDRQKSQRQLAQHYDDNARTGGSVTNQTQAKKVSEETVSAAREQMTEDLNKILNNLEYTGTNPTIIDFVNSIKRGRQLFTDDKAYSQYIAGTAKQYANQFNRIKDKEDTSVEDKAFFDSLNKLATNIDKSVTELDRQLSEIEAQNARHKKPFKNLSTIYKDKDGNEYVFDMPSAEYSENEGLILKIAKRKNNEDIEKNYQSSKNLLESAIRDEDIAMDRLQKEIADIKNSSDTNDQTNEKISELEDKIRVHKEIKDSLIKTLDSNTKQYEADKKLQFKEINVKENEDFLKSLTKTDNKGNVTTFERKLDKYIKDIDEAIAKRRTSRQNRQDNYYDGDVIEQDNSEAVTPKWTTKNEDDAPDKKLKIKAYALSSDKTNAVAKLSNPSHKSEFWSGFITCIIESGEDVKKTFEDKGQVEISGKQYSRAKAVDNFHKIGKKLNNKNNTERSNLLQGLIDGDKDSFKFFGINEKDWEEIIAVLPISARLYQKSAGRPIWIVTPDLGSRNRKELYTKLEEQAREELITNLLASYKVVKQQLSQEELDELTDSEIKEQLRNRVYVNEKQVVVTFNGFNQSKTVKTDTRSRIFQKENGEPMSNEEKEQHYQQAAQNASPIIQEDMDNFIQLLQKIGYNITADQLTNGTTTDGDNRLLALLSAVYKFGDGVIGIDTLIKYISKTVGLANPSEKVNKTNKNRAKEIVQFVMNADPTGFLSYGDAQMKYGNTPDIRQTVYIESRRPHASGISVWFEGKLLDFKDNSPENVDDLTNHMLLLEDILNNSKTEDEFIESLKNRGYRFEYSSIRATKRSQPVETELREYFKNRKFNRLSEATNIAQVITTGSSNPMNERVDFDNLNRITVVEQHNITDVKSLEIVEKNGKLYYNIKKILNKYTNKDDEVSSEYSALEQQLDEINSEELELRNKIAKNLSDSKQYVIAASGLSEEEFNEKYLLNESGTGKRRETKSLYHVILKSIMDERRSDVELAMQEIQESEQEDEKDLMPVTIAYGGASSSGINRGPIIYTDPYNGGRHSMDGVSGTPGSLYLRIPPIFHPGRTQMITKLNPKQLDQETARFIATILIGINDGSINKDSVISGTFGEYKISSSVSALEMLKNLIYIGNEAVKRSPSENNLRRLLYITDDGSVLVGQEFDRTQMSIEELTNWLMLNKTFRIDRQGLEDPNSVVNNTISVEKTDGTKIYEQKEGDDYVTFIIKNGYLTTDLNTSRDANLFTEPRVYMNYKRIIKSSASDSNTDGTAASAKKKLNTNNESKKEMQKSTQKKAVEEVIAEHQKSGKSLQLQQKVYDYFQDVITSNMEEAESKDVKLAVFVNDKIQSIVSNGKTNSIYDFEITDNGKIMIEGSFPTLMISSIAKGDAVVALVDDSGNIVELGGKKATYPLKSIKTTKQKKSDNTASNKEELLELMREFFSQELSRTPKTESEKKESTDKKVIRQANMFSSEQETKEAQKQQEENEKPSELIVVDVFGKQIEVSADYTDDQIKQVLIDNDLLSADSGKMIANIRIKEVKNALNRIIGTDKKQQKTKSGEGDIIQSLSTDNLTKYINGLSEETRSDDNAEYQAYNDAMELARHTSFQDTQKYVQSKENAKNKLKALLIKEAKSKIKNNDELIRFIKDLNTSENSKVLDDYINGQLIPFSGQPVKDFIEEQVEKEDYQQAFNRAQKILGNSVIGNIYKYIKQYCQYLSDFIFSDVNEQIDKPNIDKNVLGKGVSVGFTELNKKYDPIRQSYIYVFGQCTSAGIKLYKDANDQIVKGTLYHESFHNISLFILSDKERIKMYNDARNMYKQLEEASDKQVEEFLAQEFAKFVLAQQNANVDKIYSESKIKAFFQKIFDAVRTGINILTNANITPKYKNLDKLFKDMYSGRYAYAKATQNNIELFSKVYSKQIPYSGYKMEGKTVAKTTQQFYSIVRELIARSLKYSNVMDTSTGVFVTDWKSVHDSILADISTFQDAVITSIAEDRYEDSVRYSNLVDVYQQIEDNWNLYEKYLKNKIRREFKLESSKNSDANEMIADVDIESFGENAFEETLTKTINNDDSRKASYERDLYASMSNDCKMLLWSITDGDKYTPDGLLVYANPKSIAQKITIALQGCSSIEQMMAILHKEANKPGSEDADMFKQLVGLLQSSDDRLLNQLFTNLVRYRNNFVHTLYTSEEREDGTKEYTAKIESDNVQAVEANLKSKFRDSFRFILNGFSSKLQNTSKKDQNGVISDFKKQILVAVKSPSLFTEKGAYNLADAIQNTYGIDMTPYKALLWKYLKQFKDDSKQKQTIRNGLSVCLVSIINSDLTSSNTNVVENQIKKAFKDDSVLSGIIEFMSSNAKPTVKTDSVRGAGGAKIFLSSAYNYINRLFSARIKDKNWLQRMAKNPYSANSIWLNIFEKNDKAGKRNNIEVLTYTSTVEDQNYSSSRGYMDITGLEDIVNKFVAIMEGKHTIPSLANKKTYYYLSGFDQVPDVSTIFGTKDIMGINPQIIDRFVGYLADEFLSIANAYATREKFIQRLNKANKTNYTYETFSELSAIEQEREIRMANDSSLLNDLYVKYHYKNGNPEFVNGYLRAFHMDLRKGAAYKSRHFANMLKDFNLDEQDIESLNDDNRSSANRYAVKLASRFREQISEALLKNINQNINRFINENIIGENEFGLYNINLPANSILNNKVFNIDNKDRKILTPREIKKAIAQYTVVGMIDSIEFEKVCSGDIAFFGSDITQVNKRYSALTSTYQITSNKGMIKSEIFEDRLYDSPTFNVMMLNTTKIKSERLYRDLMKASLGVDAVTSIVEDSKSSKWDAEVDVDKLLDSNGNFTEQAKTGVLVSLYEQHRNEGRSYGLDKKGNPLTDRELAKVIVANAKTRYEAYLNTDPTDAQSWISPDMFRRLKQSEGEWSDVKEACHTILEYYDQIDMLIANHHDTFANMCSLLKTTPNEVYQRFKKFKTGNPKDVTSYKGWIITLCNALDMTSLKYVYYGHDAETEINVYAPIYDKQSYSPVYKIFADGHFMENMYQLMKDRQIDVIKMESAVKSGGVPSFEIISENGTYNKESLDIAPVRKQYFTLLGKQLNTDPHHDTTATLLTQFMKIAVSNIKREHVYNIGGNQIKGDEIYHLYKNILDELTKRGYKKFMQKYGISENGIDKKKFMDTLRDMASTQAMPSDTVDSMDVNSNGDFVIHPSALPNMNWIQSRLVADMDKTVIKTVTPGQPLYQVASIGYDGLFDGGIQKYADKQLKMFNERGAMEVKLSINFFRDVLKDAGLLNASFDVQREFILENRDLISLAYRVPTQGQNSTIPIEVVDVLEPQRGSIIMFPAQITALTGSDFDIDKMFLARFNYEVIDGKLHKITYNYNDVKQDITKVDDAKLQNLLLDIYQGILMDSQHILDTTTPLDVSTAPLKEIKKEVDTEEKKNFLDLEYLNPVFQTDQKVKNSGSDHGIGPMALNNSFSFHLQASQLTLIASEYLEKLGFHSIYLIIDKNGENILDSKSALINAHVDAVKDPFIMRMDVNDYTYDVVSFMESSGYGHDLFYFIGQPIIKAVARNYLKYKKGSIGITDQQRTGNFFMDEIQKEYLSKAGVKSYSQIATVDEMQMGFLRYNLNADRTQEWYLQQLRYLNTFKFVKNIAEWYRIALTCSQIDTAKYGINANQIINFMQKHDLFLSDNNTVFKNPEDLFNKTFLGSMYEYGVSKMFQMFKHVLFEFSPANKKAIDTLCKQYGVYGKYNTEFIRRVGPRIKTVLLSNFFNNWLFERFDSDKPLKDLMIGPNSVFGRYQRIQKKALDNNEGLVLFDMIKTTPTVENVPIFANIDNAIRTDEIARDNFQLAWTELFESDDAEVRQWAEDLAVYMFYVTGGNDTNVSGRIKVSAFDLIPPKYLANLRAGGMTYNQFITQMMNNVSNPDSQISQDYLNQAMLMTAMFDDSLMPVIKSNKQYTINYVDESTKNVAIIRKGSNQLFNVNTQNYKPLIKINTGSGIKTYRLVGTATQKMNSGAVFINPIYFAVPNICYRNQRQASYSVRCDGYIDSSTGEIISLLNEDQKFNYSSLNQLIEHVNNVAAKKKTSKYAGILKLGDLVETSVEQDYSNFIGEGGLLPSWMKNNGYGAAKSILAAIDSVTDVYYINDGLSDTTTQQYLDYVFFKNKRLHKIMSVDEVVPQPSKSITILSATNNYNTSQIVDHIIDSIPDGTNIVVTNEAVNYGQMYTANLIEEEKVSGEILHFDENDNKSGEKLTNFSIIGGKTKSGKDVYITTKPYKKQYPGQFTKTAFVFTDNAQAYGAVHPSMQLDDYNQDNTKLNVLDLAGSKTPNTAGIRTDSNGVPYVNSFGFAVKKIQQKGGKNSSFLAKEGQWKDTDADYNLFVKYIEDAINNIKAFDPENIVLPSSMAKGRAALPKRFAEKLAEILTNEFGVKATVSRNTTPGYSGYGIDITSTEQKKSDDKVVKNLNKKGIERKKECE